MNHQTWYLTLTCLVIVSGIFECREYLSSSQDIHEGHNSQQGNDVCCDPDLMQSINAIFQEAKVDDFDTLVKKFNELKSGLEYTAPDDIQDYIFSNLRKPACDLVKDSKYGTCSCDSPVVRKLIGERMEKITRMHITYTNELSELKEILNELNFPGDHPIEGESIEKQLKDLVCRQCQGLRDQKFMLECQQLINIGKTSEEKKLEVMERVVKYIKVRTLSKQTQEMNSVADNAMESMKETINQLIQTATDNNVTNCDEVFEASKPGDHPLNDVYGVLNEIDQIEGSEIEIQEPEFGGICGCPLVKCVPTNKASCTKQNCGSICDINCCTGNSNNDCTIPTCKNCRGDEAASLCNAETISKCKSRKNSLIGVLSEIYKLEIQIEEPEIAIQDPGLGSVYRGKCEAGNCNCNNCGDLCKVNICDGKSTKRCQIPTCMKCATNATMNQCKDETNRHCKGFSTHKSLNEILNEIYNLQDQIEGSEIAIEIRGKITCQILLDTLEDANILGDPQRETGNDMNEIQDNTHTLLQDEVVEEINELEF